MNTRLAFTSVVCVAFASTVFAAVGSLTTRPSAAAADNTNTNNNTRVIPAPPVLMQVRLSPSFYAIGPRQSLSVELASVGEPPNVRVGPLVTFLPLPASRSIHIVWKLKPNTTQDQIAAAVNRLQTTLNSKDLVTIADFTTDLGFELDSIVTPKPADALGH